MRLSTWVYVVAMTCGSGGAALAQTDTYRPTVIVDFSNLQQADSAAIVEALAKAQNRSAWTEITIQPNDTLYGIIAAQYRFSDALFPNLSKALAELIADTNGVSALQLPVGKAIALPTLAKRPQRGASDDLTQVIDLNNKRAFLTSADVAATGDVPSGQMSFSELQRASSWATDLSLAEHERFIDALPPDLLKRVFGSGLYSGPRDEVAFMGVPGGSVSVEPPPPSVEAGTAPSSTPTPPVELADVPLSAVGRYYVLDFFTGPEACTHGQLVVDATRQSLRSIGKSDWQQRIVPKNLDFFGNRAEAIKEIERYVNGLGSAIRAQARASLEAVKALKPPQTAPQDRPYVVPLLYLQALYGNLLSEPDTDVVSSSFWTLFDGFRVVPATYGDDSGTPLLSAVLDDAGSVIEDFTSREPLRSFHEGRNDLGLILVGASAATGTFLGMSSRTGDGVTLLEDATVTGETGACRNVVQRGTSFATPKVGVHALVMKAFWRHRQQRLSANEVKQRLVLAGSRVPSFVGRFASGAVPILSDLLMRVGATGIAPDGTIVDLSVAVDHSFIEVKSASGGLPDRFVFRKSNGFRGLEIRDGRTFMYVDSWRRWREVEVHAVKFVVGQDVPAITSIAEMAKRFRKVVLL